MLNLCEGERSDFVRDQSLEIIITAGEELPLLAAMLIRLRFSFGSRSKVPISSRISSFPHSSAGAFHRDSFVRSKIAKIPRIPSLSRNAYFSHPPQPSPFRVAYARFTIVMELRLFDSLLLLRKRITGPSNYSVFRVATTTAMTMTHAAPAENRIKRTRKLFRTASRN